MSTEIILALACALAAVAYGAWSIQWLLSKPEGDDAMREISSAIQDGASAYLKRQYMTIGLVGVVLFVVMFIFLDAATAIGFAIGAVFSGLAGFIGMNISVRSNGRTADAAKTDGEPRGKAN